MLEMAGCLFTWVMCLKCDDNSGNICVGGAFDWSTLLEGDQVAINFSSEGVFKC